MTEEKRLARNAYMREYGKRDSVKATRREKRKLLKPTLASRARNVKPNTVIVGDTATLSGLFNNTDCVHCAVNPSTTPRWVDLPKITITRRGC